MKNHVKFHFEFSLNFTVTFAYHFFKGFKSLTVKFKIKKLVTHNKTQPLIKKCSNRFNNVVNLLSIWSHTPSNFSYFILRYNNFLVPIKKLWSVLCILKI